MDTSNSGFSDRPISPAETSQRQGEVFAARDSSSSGASEVMIPPAQLQAIANIVARQLAPTLTVREIYFLSSLSRRYHKPGVPN